MNNFKLQISNFKLKGHRRPRRDERFQIADFKFQIEGDIEGGAISNCRFSRQIGTLAPAVQISDWRDIGGHRRSSAVFPCSNLKVER